MSPVRPHPIRLYTPERPKSDFAWALNMLERAAANGPSPTFTLGDDGLKRRTPMGIFTVRTSRVDGSRMDQAFISFDDSYAVNRRSPKRAHQQWKDWLRENPL